MEQYDYDTIVIGSGMGGLTAAVALAQAGNRVLVCEQHDVPGGWTHSFTLDGFRFNTGVHYVGALGDGGWFRRILEGLGVSDELIFLELNPDGYEHVFVGDQRFDIPTGRDNYVARLQDRFPHEATNIEALFSKFETISENLFKYLDGKWLSLLSNPGSLQWFLRTGGALVDKYISDPLLRTIISAQWGNSGLPPSQLSAMTYVGMIEHYMDGAYHPYGGGGRIPRAFVHALKQAGGELKLNASVDRILLDGRRVTGVELADGKIIKAKQIVSNADPEVTYGKLIGRRHLSRRLRKKIDNVTYSSGCLSLYLIVDCELKAIGMDSGNYWLMENASIEEIVRKSLSADTSQPTPGVFLSSTTLKDPGKIRQGYHQLEAIALANYDLFSEWENQECGNRDERYQELKQIITQQMLDAIARQFPAIKESVVMSNLGTPITNVHYLNAHRGNMYGIAKTVAQSNMFREKTEFDNLYMCGASILGHGVSTASLSGLRTAAIILNCHPDDLLQQSGSPLRIYPSDDTTLWPEHMLKRTEL